MAGTVTSAALILLALRSSAPAQVACGDPDNLCTGDPCVIEDAGEVESPCVVDFGTRTLVVRGRVFGRMVFTAGAIVVEPGGRLEGAVTLEASGPITVDGVVDGSFPYAAADITLDAGGTLAVGGAVRANRSLSSCNFSGCAAGNIALRGAGGVTVNGLVEARGYQGGTIELSSAAGDVAVHHKIRATRSGSVTVHADGSATIDADVVTTGGGGTIDVSTAHGDVTVDARLRGGAGTGTVVVDAGRDLLFLGEAKVASYANHGFIRLAAGGQATIGPSARLFARGGGAEGAYGGTVRVAASRVDLRGRVRTDGKGSYARGGDIRVEATDGDLTLEGVFRSRLGGIIEATAANDLTARGTFSCRPDGCVAFSAGGTLDVGAAVVDVPVVGDCPGSPSGAFL
jgi:hypothetical protein